MAGSGDLETPTLTLVIPYRGMVIVYGHLISAAKLAAFPFHTQPHIAVCSARESPLVLCEILSIFATFSPGLVLPCNPEARRW
jgi:hypothetical protein